MGQPFKSFCIVLEATLFITNVSKGGTAWLDGSDQLNPEPLSSNGCCISTKSTGVPSIPLEFMLDGIFLSTSATSHSVFFSPIGFAVGDDCTSIFFSPPKLGNKEFTIGMIIC